MLFNYARGLDFEQKPDYSYMRRGLKSILDNYLGQITRPILDWHSKLNQEHDQHNHQQKSEISKKDLKSLGLKPL